MRKFWMTLLLLSVCLIAILPPTHVWGDDDETTTTLSSTSPTTTVTSSTTNTATSTTTATTSSTTGESSSATTSSTTRGMSTRSESAEEYLIKVEPSHHTIRPNGRIRSATYAVEVKALSRFRHEVELSIEGLPEESEAMFNPEEGVPRPVFVSVLKIFVSPSTPAGVYTLTIIAASEDIDHYATAMLVVEGEAVATTTKTTATTAPRENRLGVSVSTSQENYQRGGKVGIFGYVKLRSGESVVGATVSLNVADPLGKDVHIGSIVTNQVGHYSDNFTLPLNAVDGTYTVYVTANAANYRDTFARATFTVGISDTPSIHIVNATVAMVNGTISSEFHPGETVVVWVAVNNSGADLKDGRVWVEVLDSNNVPITVVVVMVTIHNGEQMKTGLQVILRSDAPTGTYRVRALVSDAPIMAGGRFLDFKETAFIVI